MSEMKIVDGKLMVQPLQNMKYDTALPDPAEIGTLMMEQMKRELLRAESSDLTFVIMSGDFEEDMQREILKYLDYFFRLKSIIDNKKEDPAFLHFRLYENDMFLEILT